MTLTLNHVYAATSVVNAITSFSLGLYIFLGNPRSKLHQLWWWMSLCITGWAILLSITFATSPTNYSLALFANRTGNIASIFIPLLYLHFTVVFLGLQNQGRVLRVCYALSILLACFAYHPLYIQGLKTKAGIVNYNEAGPLLWVLWVLYVVEPIYAFQLMWRARQQSAGIWKVHITYVLAAGIFGFLVGTTLFPLCFRIPIPPFGNHVVWVYCILIAWAVFRYHLFDIYVVIRRSLVYSILITLLTVGYFGLVFGVEKIFQTTLGYRSTWISLLAFALMALAFQPLKIGIQRFVDWLLFRAPHEELVRRMERLEQEVLQVEKLKAVSTLAAGMAHEIKNPLTAIMTFAEFIPEKQNDPAFLKRLHEILTSESRRIYQIVREVLDFAKPKPPHIQPIDLGSLINSTVDLLSAELIKHRIQCTVNCQHNGATVQADSDQLRQVLINLIQNAADAMPKGGKLTIASQTNNGHLELTISDTGQGIPKQLLPKIFDPFVTTKEKGTGLGLAMVHSIIRAHHGTIHADSHPGHGTTFTLRLPI